MFPRLLLVLVVLAGPASASAQDVVERSDVLVPTGPFGMMRRVDSQTLILPEAGSVIRAQQRRTAALESRERAAVQTEALRQAEAAKQEAAATAAASTPAPEPETVLVEESLETFTPAPVVDESVAAPAEMADETVAEDAAPSPESAGGEPSAPASETAVEEPAAAEPASSEEPAAPQE